MKKVGFNNPIISKVFITISLAKVMFRTLVVLARLYSVQGETPKLHQNVEAGKLCNSSLKCLCLYQHFSNPG